MINLSNVYTIDVFCKMIALNFTPFPVLVTERLTLRKLSAEDAPGIFLLRSDRRVNAFLDRPILADIDGAHQFINKREKAVAANESLYWVITQKDDNSLIGTICIWNIDTEKEQAEIGFEMRPEFQGKGLMQEAVQKVKEFGFAVLKLSVITALTKAENRSSVNVLLKNKFQLDKSNQFVSKEAADELEVYYLLSSFS